MAPGPRHTLAPQWRMHTCLLLQKVVKAFDTSMKESDSRWERFHQAPESALDDQTLEERIKPGLVNYQPRQDIDFDAAGFVQKEFVSGSATSSSSSGGGIGNSAESRVLTNHGPVRNHAAANHLTPRAMT